MPRQRSILLILASCIAMGALPPVVQAVFVGMGARNFLLSSLMGFVYASCIALPCWASMQAISRRLRGRSAGVRIAAHVVILGVAAAGGCLVANVILLAVGLVGPAQLWTVFRNSLRICLLVTFTAGALTMVIMTLRSQLESARDQLHQREVAEERERKMAAEARYASLESRVRPHFLFNTLNSISALVREDPPEAERMIERLAALLRFSLDSELAGLVTLREELRIVRDYLEIESVRFGARLRYSIEAEEAALERSVPALSVQTLVENSVKYAVGSQREGASIQVRAWVVAGRLRVEVGDDGPGFEEHGAMKPGHGLDLLRRRLAGLFGAAAALEISGAAGNTTVAMSVDS